MPTMVALVPQVKRPRDVPEAAVHVVKFEQRVHERSRKFPWHVHDHLTHHFWPDAVNSDPSLGVELGNHPWAVSSHPCAALRTYERSMARFPARA